MIISPPDMVLEAGNSSTVARRNVPPANSRAAFGSRSSLNFVHRFLRPGRIESLRNRDNWSRLDVSLAFGKGVEHVLRQIEVGSQDVFRRHVDQSVIETVPCPENAPLSNDSSGNTKAPTIAMLDGFSRGPHTLWNRRYHCISSNRLPAGRRAVS